MNFSTVFYGYVIIGSYKVFGSQHIKDDIFLTLVGSVGALCGSLRFIWSLMLDNGCSYVRVYGFLAICQLITSGLIYQSVIRKDKVVFSIVVSLSIFCEGGHFTLLPSHCAEVFGSSKRGVQAFSYLFSCFGLSSIVGGVV